MPALGPQSGVLRGFTLRGSGRLQARLSHAISLVYVVAVMPQCPSYQGRVRVSVGSDRRCDRRVEKDWVMVYVRLRAGSDSDG